MRGGKRLDFGEGLEGGDAEGVLEFGVLEDGDEPGDGHFGFWSDGPESKSGTDANDGGGVIEGGAEFVDHVETFGTGGANHVGGKPAFVDVAGFEERDHAVEGVIVSVPDPPEGFAGMKFHESVAVGGDVFQQGKGFGGGGTDFSEGISGEATVLRRPGDDDIGEGQHSGGIVSDAPEAVSGENADGFIGIEEEFADGGERRIGLFPLVAESEEARFPNADVRGFHGADQSANFLRGARRDGEQAGSIVRSEEIRLLRVLDLLGIHRPRGKGVGFERFDRRGGSGLDLGSVEEDSGVLLRGRCFRDELFQFGGDNRLHGGGEFIFGQSDSSDVRNFFLFEGDDSPFVTDVGGLGFFNDGGDGRGAGAESAGIDFEIGVQFFQGEARPGIGIGGFDLRGNGVGDCRVRGRGLRHGFQGRGMSGDAEHLRFLIEIAETRDIIGRSGRSLRLLRGRSVPVIVGNLDGADLLGRGFRLGLFQFNDIDLGLREFQGFLRCGFGTRFDRGTGRRRRVGNGIHHLSG